MRFWLLAAGTPHRLQLTHNAVGHEVVPVEFASAVIPLVEVFHLRDQVLQLRGQRDKNLLTASWPRAGVQDLNVHAVRCREKWVEELGLVLVSYADALKK